MALCFSFNKYKMRKFNSLLFIGIYFLFFLFSCNKADNKKEASIAEETNIVTYNNPVLPGDFADPSVVRVGNDYWATATSSEWAPLFPILHSTNLVDWEIVGHVFPEEAPEWTEAHYWAPEIAYENGTFYIYYTAKKEGGNLCVGVASATNPKGPYKDHGALVCQEAGSIDGFPIRDENGELHLIWKEDGNSVGKPTPMWGQKMNEARTELLGEKFELFRNDPETWEGGLVEGAYILRKNGYFYTFYAGDACCGRGCTYGVGVARSKKLEGPWEKYEQNPIMKQNETWKCAGHGSVVTDTTGNYYYLYHAYSTDGFVYTGRQGLLDKITWGEDNWPHFEDNAPSAQSHAPHQENAPDNLNLTFEFDKSELAETWQWPVEKSAAFKINPENDGQLIIQAGEGQLGNLVAQRTLSADYQVTAAINLSTLGEGVQAGLTAIGDQDNAVGVSVVDREVVLWSIKAGERIIHKTLEAPEEDVIQLRLITRDGDKMEFSWSTDKDEWQALNADEPIDASYLPPWDRAVRVGLNVKGSEGKTAAFDWFKMATE